MVAFTRKQLEAKDKDELIDIILSLQSMVEAWRPWSLPRGQGCLAGKGGRLAGEGGWTPEEAYNEPQQFPAPSKDLTGGRYPKGGGQQGQERRSGANSGTVAARWRCGHPVSSGITSRPDCPGCSSVRPRFPGAGRRQVVDIPPSRRSSRNTRLGRWLRLLPQGHLPVHGRPRCSTATTSARWYATLAPGSSSPWPGSRNCWRASPA